MHQQLFTPKDGFSFSTFSARLAPLRHCLVLPHFGLAVVGVVVIEHDESVMISSHFGRFQTIH